MQPIIFYDIPNAKPNLQERAWSPNTWKIRFALNYKNLPYTTVWVEYPDIAALCIQIGAAPTDPGAAYGAYTLPAIHDPNTGRTLADSLPITRYLDAAYPDRPAVLPRKLAVLSRGFASGFARQLGEPLWDVIIPAVNGTLGARGEAYFRRTRESEMGRLEDVAPAGSERRVEAWRGIEAGFGRVARWFDGEEEGEERTWVLGDAPSYADFVVGGYLMWIRNTFGAESEEWRNMERWDGGRWGRLAAELLKYGAVDEGTAFVADA